MPIRMQMKIISGIQCGADRKLTYAMNKRMNGPGKGEGEI